MKKYKLGALNVSDKGLQDTKEEIVIELIDRMQKYVADGKAAFENGSFTTEQKLNQVKYCCGRFCGLSDFLVGTMGIDVRALLVPVTSGVGADVVSSSPLILCVIQILRLEVTCF